MLIIEYQLDFVAFRCSVADLTRTEITVTLALYARRQLRLVRTHRHLLSSQIKNTSSSSHHLFKPVRVSEVAEWHEEREE